MKCAGEMEESEKVGSPKGKAEIDTRAPFQSVKDAVNLFGEVASSKLRPPLIRKLSSQNVIDKETHYMLAQRELKKLKLSLEAAETARARALPELELAKRTLHDLTTKLDAVAESKRSTIAAAEAVKELAKKLEAEMSLKAVGTEAWKRELHQLRKGYADTVTELDASKQALTDIRRDFDDALEAKLAAFQRAGEAQRSANAGAEKSGEISAQLAAMKASVERLTEETRHAQQEQATITTERDASLRAFKAAKECVAKKLDGLRRESVDPEVTRGVETELAEASSAVEAVREEMRRAHEAEMEGVRAVTRELDEATKTLQEVGEEERSLRKLVSELKETEVSDEQRLAVQRLKEETESAAREEEEMRRSAGKVREITACLMSVTAETESELKVKEAAVEAAKERERNAVGVLKSLSAKIRVSVEEFNSLTRKVETAQSLAEPDEAKSEAVVTEIGARKAEAERKLEANLKAIEEIKIATDLALRKAEMSESAKTIVESELRRWRVEEHKSGQLRS